MTNKERVIQAIEFKKTDKIPHNIDFTHQIYEIVQKELGSNYINTINNHISIVDLNKPQIEIASGMFEDEYSVIWDKTGADKDIGMPAKYSIKTEEDFLNYSFPLVDENYIRTKCKDFFENTNDNFKVVNLGFSMYERLWTLMGIEDALCNMMTEPEFIHSVLNKICERNLKIIQIALEYDFDAMLFGDDWGQQNHLIMGPQLWREFIKPYVSKMYDAVKKKGKYVAQHSCGDIREIMADLYDMGLNIYQTFQPEIYGLDYSEKLAGKIVIWGGISTQYHLPYKTPDEITQITKELLAHFKETGGLIVAPTHSVPADVPMENIKAMVNVFLNQ